MALTVAASLSSSLCGLVLASFYTLNKSVGRFLKPPQAIFWVFVWHMPIILLWMCIDWPPRVDSGYVIPGLAVLALSLLGDITTLKALMLSPFSLMIPVLGLSPVFSTLLAIPLLHEWPTIAQWIGIILSVLGVFWLYAPPDRPWAVFSFWSGFIKERGAPMMTFSALIWALTAPMDRLALQHASAAFHAVFVYTGVVIGIGFVFLNHQLWPEPPFSRKRWLSLAITGLLGGTSSLLQLAALRITPAGPFEAIKRTISQLIALVIGALMFSEPMTKPKIIGIVILCIGIPLIVF